MPLFSTLALIATAPLPEDTAEPLVLKAASQWTLEYADNACNIGRTFGPPEQPLLLALKLLPGRGNTVFVVDERRPGKSPVKYGELAITTSPEAAPISVRVTSGSARAGSHLMYGALSGEELSAIERADAVSLSYQGKVVRLTGVKLKVALAASIACEDDLLRTWGIDAPAFRSIAVRAKPRQSPARWVTNDDYPAASVSAREQGSVDVRLDIDATGDIAACTVLRSSKFPRLDQRTCEVLRKRGRYEPARLADGTPTASLAFLRFRWSTSL